MLKRRAMALHMRVIGTSYRTFLEQQGSSPVLDKILTGISRCEPGKTYNRCLEVAKRKDYGCNGCCGKLPQTF
jgi:hypothetical protein